jgi:FlaA1/EpsC-like NDP-sugar epimerase
MFSHQRKARVLFGLSDIVLATLAFEIAYRTRFIQHWHFLFYLTMEQKVLVLGFSLFAWVTIGSWLEVYEKLDSGHPRTILRDSARQCVYGALCLVVFEYAMRMDLSRFFLALYCSLTWVLLLVFRLTAGRVVGMIRREFAAPHYVMVVGTGERAISMAKALEHSAEYGVQLRGFFTESAGCPDEIALGSLHKVYPISEMPSILRQHVVDEIVFAVGSESLADLEEAFLLCDQEGVRTRVAVDFFPHVNSTVSLSRWTAWAPSPC